MLKKAGILVGVAAAGVLAITPFAFANNDSQKDAPAVTSITSVQDGNLTNDCPLEQAGPEVDQDVTGGSSLADVGGLVTGAVAPITTQTQLLNCANVGISDVIDVNSNNDETSVTESETEDSFNESVTVED